MKKQIKLIPGYDPDKYRDELCEISWKKSRAKTIEEHIKYIMIGKNRKTPPVILSEKKNLVANPGNK